MTDTPKILETRGATFEKWPNPEFWPLFGRMHECIVLSLSDIGLVHGAAAFLLVSAGSFFALHVYERFRARVV